MSVSVTTSLTPNYAFTLPVIGGDQDSWGSELNANWSKLDGILHGISAPPGGGSAYLPVGGGQMTGPLYLASNPTANMMAVNMSWVTANFMQTTGTQNIAGPLGVKSYVACSQVGIGQPTVTDFWISTSGNNRVIDWANNVYDQYIPSSAAWNRTWGGTVIWFMDSSGTISIGNQAYKPGGGPWTASSDDRVKTSVVPYTAGLDAVLQLSPIAYSYNGQGGTMADGKTYYGLSAQATRSIMPEMVCNMPAMGTPPDGSKQTPQLPGQLGTDLTALPLALINCVQALNAKITALEGRLAAQT